MRSDATGKPSKIIIEPTAGTSFRLCDGALRVVAQTTSRWEGNQPPGLFQIEWNSAGRVEQEVFSLAAGETITMRPPTPDRGDPLPELPSGQVAWSLPSAATLVDNSLRPTDRLTGSSVAVIVAHDRPPAKSAARDFELRLMNSQDEEMRSDIADATGLPADLGDAVSCYDVGAGRYRLRFRSMTGETLEQSVPALAGRRTIVFLRSTTVNLMVAGEEKFSQRASSGVDAAKSVIVSIAGDESAERIHERIRLANVLIHDLATGGTSLSQSFIEILDDPATDPLLRLYAGLIVVGRLTDGVAPALEMATGSGSEQDWARHVTQWVPKPAVAGLPTDAAALWWQLVRFAPSLKTLADTVGVPSRIEVPPMFERSWSWAITQSVDDPRAVPNTSLNLATGRSAGGTAPWLCWRTAATKATAATPPGSTARPEDLVRSILTKAAELIETDSVAAQNLLTTLSPESQATAARILQIVTALTTTDVQATTADAAASLLSHLADIGSTALASALATSLGLPSAQLRRRLARIDNEIDTAIAAERSTATTSATALPSGTPSSLEAPALRRAVARYDDPNKGRFGGRAQRGGFALEARFEARSSGVTKIIMTVRGPAEDGEVAYFYLHDSFKPPEKTKRFKAGIAELVATAWGGFTLGIWLPRPNIELELDLAERDDAPLSIRTR